MNKIKQLLLKNKITSLLILGILTVILISFEDCSLDRDDMLIEPEEEQTIAENSIFTPTETAILNVYYSGNHNISREEAREKAVTVAQQMSQQGNDGGNTSRNGKRNIKEIIAVNPQNNILQNEITSRNNESESSTPSTFIVNFTNDGGYVFMSGDKRADYILIQSDQGNLNLNDSIDNPGIKIALDNAYAFLNRKIQQYEFKKDSIINLAKKDSTLFKVLEKMGNYSYSKLSKSQKDNIKNNKGGLTSYNNTCPAPYQLMNVSGNNICVGTKERIVYTNVQNTYIGGTLSAPGLTYNLKWHQGSPFNQGANVLNCPGNNNTIYKGKAPAGSVATALGIIAAYHKKPDNIRILVGNDWSAMTTPSNYNNGTLPLSGVQQSIARLIRIINFGARTSYACYGSTATNANARQALASPVFRYSSTPILNYNLIDVKAELDKSRPVYASARNVGGGFHAWVIDGYKLQTRTKTEYTDYYLYSNGALSDEVLSTTASPSVNETVTYVHNNWGWGGNGNNYTLGTSFSPNGSSTSYKYLNKIIKMIPPSSSGNGGNNPSQGGGNNTQQ